MSTSSHSHPLLLSRGISVLTVHPLLDNALARATVVGWALVPTDSLPHISVQTLSHATATNASTSATAAAAATAAQTAGRQQRTPELHVAAAAAADAEGYVLDGAALSFGAAVLAVASSLDALQLLYRVRFEGAPNSPCFVSEDQIFLLPAAADAATAAAASASAVPSVRASVSSLSAVPPAFDASAASSDSFLSGSSAQSDARLLAHLLQLLDRKALLVEQLAHMNQTAADMQEYTHEHEQEQRQEEQLQPPQQPPQQPQQLDENICVLAASSDDAMQIDELAPAVRPVPAPHVELSAPSSAAAAASSMSPAELVSAHDLFLHQYSWVLLALERTSSALDQAHRAVRARVAAARARQASEAASSLSALQSLSSKASTLVRHGVLALAHEGALLGGKDALATKASLSDPSRRPHQLVSAGVALFLALQRALDPSTPADWMHHVTPDLLHAVAPQHPEHTDMHARIAAALRELQRMLAHRDQHT